MDIKDKKLIATNKKAKFNYELKETFEAGLVLEGWHVKSFRSNKFSLDNNPYVTINSNGEAFVSGLSISPHVDNEKIDKHQTIKLLLHKKEINGLIGKVEQKGFTIVLVDLYWKNNKVKATIALAKGKNLGDKRQTVKERDSKIEADRAMKKAL